MNSLAFSNVNYLFRCDACRFVSDNKKDYGRHILTAKHAKRAKTPRDRNKIHPSEHLSVDHNKATFPHWKPPIVIQSQPQSAFVFDQSIYKYCEKCGQKYHSKSGLWKHRKTCDASGVFVPPPHIESLKVQPPKNDTVTTTDQEFKMMMMDMLKNNQEFQHKILEMMCTHQQTIAASAASAAAAAVAATTAPGLATDLAFAATGPPPAPITNYTNSNNYSGMTNSQNTNNTFNLQFFLNEKCKDAMNITDFASSIHLKITDLDDFASVGYVEGMSKLFIDSLRETDVYKRPIHCSDARRETLYVKDDDKWEREGPENTKITNAVRVVEHKNIVLVNEWAKQNPRCENSSTKENTQYINMSRAVLDGDDKNIAKVIKKVAKEVVIEKP
jgi:uncharacterized C2H2 Zn-finger protein